MHHDTPRARLGAMILAWLLCAAPAAQAADWHVAPGGTDGAAGSEAAPLATVAHAVSRASSGDRILLQRGGTYVVSELDLGANLEVDAYGSGPLPVLTASVEVSLPDTWSQNANVRTGAVADRVLAVYVDGQFVRLARYPNLSDGFLRVDNDDDPDQIVDSDLASRPGVAPGRWTGAQVRWRRWSWFWETRVISSHSANDTLDLSIDGRSNVLNSDPGSGYFIDNDLDELDAPGEWYWEGGTLYLYPPSWANPSTMRVDVVTTQSTDALVDPGDEPVGVHTGGTSLHHVHFTRFFGTALQIGHPATVEDCTFSEIESNAIGFTWDAQPFEIRRSIFRDIRNIAISGWANDAGPTGSVIERNLFLRIGVEPGYGGNGPWHAAGVIVGNANAAVVRLNRFVDTGYAGIILGSDGQTVERNVFVRTMETLNDGAAIYTNCSDSTIHENIILDTVGDLVYSHPWYPLGHGIWLEFLSEFHDSVVTYNTIYGSNGHGIFLPNNYNCTLTGNVCMDNRRAGLGLYRHNDDSGYNPNQNHTISGHVLVAVAPTRRVLQADENLSQWWLPPYDPPLPVALEYETTSDYGQMTATTFIAAATDAAVIREQVHGGGSSEMDTLAAWTAAASWADDTDSRVVRANAILLFNYTEASADVPVPTGTWTLPDGTAVGATVSLAPFRSQVLITNDAVPSSPPYIAASGIDWRAETPTTSWLSPDPEIVVTRDGVVVVDGGTDAVTGTAPGSGRSLTWQIRNEGGAALTLSPPVTVSGESNCAVTVDPQPGASLNPGATTSLGVTVTPAAEGAWSFGLSLANNDSDENPMDFTVSGTAVVGGDADAGVTGDGAVPTGDGAAPTGDASPTAGDGGGGGDDGGQGCGCSAGAQPLPAAPLLSLLLLVWIRRRRR